MTEGGELEARPTCTSYCVCCVAFQIFANICLQSQAPSWCSYKTGPVELNGRPLFVEIALVFRGLCAGPGPGDRPTCCLDFGAALKSGVGKQGHAWGSGVDGEHSRKCQEEWRTMLVLLRRLPSLYLGCASKVHKDHSYYERASGYAQVPIGSIPASRQK